MVQNDADTNETNAIETVKTVAEIAPDYSSCSNDTEEFANEILNEVRQILGNDKLEKLAVKIKWHAT